MMTQPDPKTVRRAVALVTALTLTALLALAASPGFSVEEQVATSPLIGATRIDERGEARVEEVVVTGRYAYLRLDSSAPGEWHVVTGRAPQLGETIRYRGYAELHGFRSPSLDRTFERLIFASTKSY